MARAVDRPEPGAGRPRATSTAWSPALGGAGARRGASCSPRSTSRALPLALVLRLAGVGRISAISDDYPGSLLDVRHRDRRTTCPRPSGRCRSPRPPAIRCPPATTARSRVAAPAAGVAADRPSRLRRRAPRRVGAGPGLPAGALPRSRRRAGRRRAPGASSPAARASATLTARVAGGRARPRPRRADRRWPSWPRSWPAPTRWSSATPGRRTWRPRSAPRSVRLFAPTVPAGRWAPYGVPHVLLGDQDAPCPAPGRRGARCRATRA